MRARPHDQRHLARPGVAVLVQARPEARALRQLGGPREHLARVDVRGGRHPGGVGVLEVLDVLEVQVLQHVAQAGGRARALRLAVEEAGAHAVGARRGVLETRKLFSALVGQERGGTAGDFTLLFPF